jgi:hypothetical protein
LTEAALESYELIWCGSVLTHVHPGTWTRFLDVFEVHLKPGGYLVFSTAGRRVAARLRDNPRLDLGLTSEAKHRLLDVFGVGRAYEDYPQQSGYGISLAQPSFVMGLLEQRPTLRLVSFEEMAWGNFQDLVACRAAAIDQMPRPDAQRRETSMDETPEWLTRDVLEEKK